MFETKMSNSDPYGCSEQKFRRFYKASWYTYNGGTYLPPEFISVAGSPHKGRSPSKEARRYVTGTDGADFNTLASQLYKSGDLWMFGLKVVNVKPRKEKGEEENRHEAATQG